MVDDEEALCDTLAFNLESEGYQVDTAYSAEGALTMNLAGYDLILLDIMMGEISGIQLARIMKSNPSMADRAWGRESAVFRITGVISVIGGWFLTAGAAFIGAGVIVAAMHFGGHWVMFLLAALTIFIIIRSNRRFAKKATTLSSRQS